MFENKKIFVLGMAKSGYNVAKLLAPKNEVVVTDAKEQDPKLVSELEALGVKVIITDKPLEIFGEDNDMLVKNPGIMPFHEVCQKAQELNIPILNEMEVAYHFLPEDITIIGVTGSNGKTTTTTMIYEMLKAMNKPVVLGGNIGYPLSEVIPVIKPKDILLLEISDHQLINFQDFKTDISVLTNICPTHLDYHGSYEKYMQVKKKIFNHHDKASIAIINKQNADSLKITEDILSTKLYFNSADAYVKDGYICLNGESVIALDAIKVKGMHNYENIMAALLVVKEFALDIPVIQKFLGEFGGVEHRIEFVLEHQGRKFYNDSKATNPTSTIIALKSFDAPIHLILGGMQRNQDFHELDEVISKCKCIYAIGEVTKDILAYAKEMGIACEECYTLENAMAKIAKNTLENEVILLSPASASWDQYARFEDRGDEFKKYCKEIIKRI